MAYSVAYKDLKHSTCVRIMFCQAEESEYEISMTIL